MRRNNYVQTSICTSNPQITINQPANIKIGDIGHLISALVGVLLILSALIAFFYLIMGGISWITSGGDKAAMETARNKITHAIVGLIIVGAGVGGYDPCPELPGHSDHRWNIELPHTVLN